VIIVITRLTWDYSAFRAAAELVAAGPAPELMSAFDPHGAKARPPLSVSEFLECYRFFNR
jgi:hypothetical protein